MALDNLLRDKLDGWLARAKTIEVELLIVVLLALCDLADAVRQLEEKLDSPARRARR